MIIVRSQGAVILLRDVEHCGISSVNGTSSMQFPEFRPNLTDSQEFLSVPEFCSIPATSTDSESNQFPEFRNSVQTESNEIGTDSRNSGIRRNRTEFLGIPSDSALAQFLELHPHTVD